MMTDRDLVSARTFVESLSAAARARQTDAGDVDEQQAARDVARHAMPLKLAIERWLLLRATRAALQQ